MTSLKNTFEPLAFGGWTFACGTWRGGIRTTVTSLKGMVGLKPSLAGSVGLQEYAKGGAGK